ncbi:GspE/PulE family protein [Anaerovibrio sp.]|uniref:GspE/PulE family protein n=1 Tax=Anaerovibrio sp. TaxID=1872532 RepID=UPI0025C40027|nr:GspE/PulE family protein [Anaerovibrio sp.]MBR2142381.1 type II/IV secretion system protein [Anaerovibrio sp.]
MTSVVFNKKLEDLLAVAQRDNTASREIHFPQAPTHMEVKSPLMEVVDYIIEDALGRGASDIHVEPGETMGRLRYRIDGILETMIPPIPMELYGNIISRLKIMCRLNIAEYRLPQDGRFSYEYFGKKIDVRVSIVPLINGEKAVLRLLNRAERFISIDGLDLTAKNKEQLIELCHRSGGAVIIAGPVNSGKTTTLYGVLDLLNNSQKNIITLEDPVEYQLKGINQLQINTKIKLDFSDALKATLRQDYDVLAVGEVRSSEVADLLVRASLAGHLVLATIHTSSAAKVIYRMLEMGIKPYLLGIAIKGIVAQRLLPRLCPDCCSTYLVEPDSPVARFLGEEFRPGMQLYHRQGCDKCNGKGVKGRIALHEILVIDEKIQECITNRCSLAELEQAINEKGMISIKQDGIAKALAGLVEIEAVMEIDDISI